MTMTIESLCSAMPDLNIIPLNHVSASFYGCYTGDLLSDVLAHAKAGSILVTVQAHENTIAVAAEKKLPAILFCNGRHPPAEVISLADSRNIALASTICNQFETSAAIATILSQH